jgi:prepilin-type N-terminal cleavage/methylation domain-containing protein
VVTDRARRASRQAGFTLLEVLSVLALSSVVLAIYVGFFPRAAAMVQGDADQRIVNGQLQLARKMAMSQHRAIQLQFLPPNRLQLVRIEPANGTTVLGDTYLEHNTQFMLFAGQPDTPDGYGNTTPISFGAAATVMFAADGKLTDAGGNPVNGTVFLGQPGKPFSARAVTIEGPTANIRLWRWNGTAWRR